MSQKNCWPEKMSLESSTQQVAKSAFWESLLVIAFKIFCQFITTGLILLPSLMEFCRAFSSISSNSSWALRCFSASAAAWSCCFEAFEALVFFTLAAFSVVFASSPSLASYNDERLLKLIAKVISSQANEVTDPRFSQPTQITAQESKAESCLLHSKLGTSIWLTDTNANASFLEVRAGLTSKKGSLKASSSRLKCGSCSADSSSLGMSSSSLPAFRPLILDSRLRSLHSSNVGSIHSHPLIFSLRLSTTRVKAFRDTFHGFLTCNNCDLLLIYS